MRSEAFGKISKNFKNFGLEKKKRFFAFFFRFWKFWTFLDVKNSFRVQFCFGYTRYDLCSTLAAAEKVPWDPGILESRDPRISGSWDPMILGSQGPEILGAWDCEYLDPRIP